MGSYTFPNSTTPQHAVPLNLHWAGTYIHAMQLTTEREKVAHLLRRFGLGASEAELDYYASDGHKGSISKLLDYDKVDEGFDVPITAFKLKDQKLIPMQAVVTHWVMRLLVTRRPLQEKMTLFWHDHFATSASKVVIPPLMYQQIETLRAGATGKFGDLLQSVSKDPAMLFWLDNQFNQVGKPNENFAREVMELFTLGVGNYTEKDIQEAARAFTGWAFLRRRQQPDQDDFKGAEFLLRPRMHDTTAKTVFGKTGDFGGEDVLKMLCENPQCAKFLTTKLWSWFGYENPEPALIERLASGFVKSDLDIKTLLRSMMESPEFYSPKAVRKVYKNPVDFVVATMRQMGYGELLAGILKRTTEDGIPPASRMFGATSGQAMQSMGMQLLFPPDVSGWETGPSWITSATMVQRIGWADRLFGQAKVTPGTRNPQIQGLNVFSLYEKDPSPMGVAKKLTSIFDANLPETKVKTLADAAKTASGGQVDESNANAVSAKVCRLIFGSPEFQFV